MNTSLIKGSKPLFLIVILDNIISDRHQNDVLVLTQHISPHFGLIVLGSKSISTSCSGRTGNGDVGYCSQRTLPTNGSLAWPQSCGAPYMWRGTVFEASSSVPLKATVASFFGLLTVSSSSCLQLPPPTVHSHCNRLHKIKTKFMPLNPIAILLGPRAET